MHSSLQIRAYSGTGHAFDTRDEPAHRQRAICGTRVSTRNGYSSAVRLSCKRCIWLVDLTRLSFHVSHVDPATAATNAEMSERYVRSMIEASGMAVHTSRAYRVTPGVHLVRVEFACGDPIEARATAQVALREAVGSIDSVNLLVSALGVAMPSI